MITIKMRQNELHKVVDALMTLSQFEVMRETPQSQSGDTCWIPDEVFRAMEVKNTPAPKSSFQLTRVFHGVHVTEKQFYELAAAFKTALKAHSDKREADKDIRTSSGHKTFEQAAADAGAVWYENEQSWRFNKTSLVDFERFCTAECRKGERESKEREKALTMKCSQLQIELNKATMALADLSAISRQYTKPPVAKLNEFESVLDTYFK